MFYRFILLILPFYLANAPSLPALTAGVAIPCYYKHFHYLPALLDALTLQTCLPEQVIISLSEVEKLDPDNIDKLENGAWPFEVDIIRREGVHMEGSNRTLAATCCNCDIVLCIDADDIPHPQRVEAVLQLFEAKPDAMLVLCGHAYCPGESIICEPSIPFFSEEAFREIRFNLGKHTWKLLKKPRDLTLWESGVHNGAPSLRRVLLADNLQWSDRKNGADLEFNSTVIRQYRCYLIQLPLLHYYNGRSSGADVGR